MVDTLLVVSGKIPPDIHEQVKTGKRPRPDYLALASSLQADILDYSEILSMGNLSTRIIRFLGGINAAMAWECFRRRGRYSLIFTDGEQVGIPFAVFLKFLDSGKRNVRHAMIVHILSVRNKMLFFDLLKIESAIDRFFVYATYQQNFIINRWKVPREKVAWIPFQADGQFFHPLDKADQEKSNNRQMICSAGLEFRDYPTLLSAVDGLDVDVVLAAASPWSKRSDTTQNRDIPKNVTVQRFSLFDMRELYDRASFVVVPLYPVFFQAGVTTIMEAMAMGKAVIVTRTPGQTDYVQDGISGIYVPPGDIPAIRDAILRLLANPAEAARLGQNARDIFKKEYDLDCYVDKINQVISGLLEEAKL